MDEPWHPLNRRSPRPDPVFFWGSWVTGAIAFLLFAIEITVQVRMHYLGHP